MTTFQINKVSTFAQNQSATNAHLRIQHQMAEAQRQLTSGVKEVTFKGYGIQSQIIQEYRAGIVEAENYIENIDRTRIQMKQMNLSLDQLKDQIEIVIGQADINPQEGIPDIEGMQRLAENARRVMVDVLNTKDRGRYVFSGSDVTNAPYETTANLDARISQELTDWLDQTNTATDFLNNIDGLTQSQTGYSLTVQSSGNVTARADERLEVDYTIKANADPFARVMRALSVFMQLDVPDPDVDLATRDQYYEIENRLTQDLVDAIEEIRGFSAALATDELALDRAREDHVDQRATLLNLMEDTESINSAEVITEFQTLRTQLETSYRATSITQQLSLSQFI